MSHRKKDFADETDWLKRFCKANRYAFEARELNAPTYQLARITGSDFRMVAYPHKTSAGNYHIRIRDEGSKNKAAFADALYLLYNGKEELNHTFQSKDFNLNEALERKYA